MSSFHSSLFDKVPFGIINCVLSRVNNSLFTLGTMQWPYLKVPLLTGSTVAQPFSYICDVIIFNKIFDICMYVLVTRRQGCAA